MDINLRHIKHFATLGDLAWYFTKNRTELQPGVYTLPWGRCEISHPAIMPMWVIFLINDQDGGEPCRNNPAIPLIQGPVDAFIDFIAAGLLCVLETPAAHTTRPNHEHEGITIVLSEADPCPRIDFVRSAVLEDPINFSYVPMKLPARSFVYTGMCTAVGWPYDLNIYIPEVFSKHLVQQRNVSTPVGPDKNHFEEFRDLILYVDAHVEELDPGTKFTVPWGYARVNKVGAENTPIISVCVYDSGEADGEREATQILVGHLKELVRMVTTDMFRVRTFLPGDYFSPNCSGLIILVSPKDTRASVALVWKNADGDTVSYKYTPGSSDVPLTNVLTASLGWKFSVSLNVPQNFIFSAKREHETVPVEEILAEQFPGVDMGYVLPKLAKLVQEDASVQRHLRTLFNL